MKIELRPVDDIKPYERNPRKNDQAVDAVAESIATYGFRQPIVLDKDGGEGRMKPDTRTIKNDLDHEELIVLGAMMLSTADLSLDESVGSLDAEHFVSPVRREVAARIFVLRLTTSEAHAPVRMVTDYFKDEPKPRKQAVWGVVLGAYEAVLSALEAVTGESHDPISAASRALLDRGPLPDPSTLTTRARTHRHESPAPKHR